MPDADSTDSHAGATVELPVQQRPAGVGVSLELRDYRDQLPGTEPERHLTDWGRSERVEGVVDRALYDFLYRYWFRVEVEGAGNVPADGPALLIANHAGALPSDAVMIAKAIKEELPRPRPVHLLSEQQLGRLPGLGMLFTKLGGVGAHPANIHRLLFDEEQLVLLFPEGAAGARKPLKERYRMREFGPMPFVEQALRARAPIVPVAVVGAEEAAPVFARLESLRRLARLPLLPAVALPAKFRVRFLEPVQPTAQAPVRLRRGDMEPGSADRLAEEIRALIQENLFEMVAARRSVWLG